jgi:hypothetical protein
MTTQTALRRYYLLLRKEKVRPPALETIQIQNTNMNYEN